VIIADGSARLPRLLAVAAMLAGAASWLAYLRADLILSHYDARAHLVVARRVMDNLTPGWQQIGAVWLPLPHVLNMIAAQVDVFYRTGVTASALSVGAFGLTAYALARLVLATTGSTLGATTATALLVLNPNLLYLAATPMTEPLLIGVTSLAVLGMYEWVERDDDRVPARLGFTLAAAALTRYEAWVVIAASIAAAVYAVWRRGASAGAALRRGSRLCAWPAAAIAIFLVNSRITVGAWFVSGGFYVPDPEYQGKTLRAVMSVWWATHELSGYAIETVALASAAVLAVRAAIRPRDASLLIPVALAAAAALPAYAFFEGHPFRIRYMIPLVAACAALGGIGVGLARGAGGVLALVLIASTLVESPPRGGRAPMIEEAQWDRPNSAGRRAVTVCLTKQYGGEKIVASMGSLAHYMHELSREGFDIADFVHEGNGVIWEMALETGPAPHAGWMLIEEQAEGGDILAQRVRQDDDFARGMIRVCEGGGVALYRRDARRSHGATETRRP
jgi:hypothetical protein